MNASNYFKEKEDLQNQITLLAGFLSHVTNNEFQKIHFEIHYLILKLQTFDKFFVKNRNYRFEPMFETIASSINVYCNTQPYENLLMEKDPNRPYRFKDKTPELF